MRITVVNGARRSGATEVVGTMSDSFKTEEKTVTAAGIARGEGRIPTTLEVSGRQPTSAPTRCVSSWTEHMTIFSRESTP